ncbi:MAG: adenylate/guanylate cyclase domain-containing protein, partial [Candidatus Kapaibacterium sp.]
DKNEMAMTLGSIGIIYTEQLDYIKALESYEKALKYNQEIGKKRGIAYDYLSLGILYQIISEDSTLSRDTKELKNVSLDREVNLNKSINYLLEAEILYTKMNSLIELSRLYNTLYKAYYQKGNYKASIDAHVNYKNLQDSIFSKEKTDKIAELEKVREDDVNRIQIEKQKVQLEAQESEKMFIVYSGVGIVGFIIAILIIIVYQRKKSDKLLYNVLPISIAKRLKKKEHPISDHFVQASIIFIDIVGFTAMSKNSDPTDIVQALNKIFTHYDNIASRHGLEKIKTIGDCYMAAAGIPVIQKDNTLRAARMAIEVRDYMVDYYTDHGFKLDVRIGLDCGPVVAGVIGEKKFIYDMWSDAVNTASRMESTGQSGSVHISERFKEVVAEFDEFEFEARGEMEVKGKGLMNTYFIEYRKAEVV